MKAIMREQPEMRWQTKTLIYKFIIMFIITALITYFLVILYSYGDVRRQRAIAETQEKGIINIQQQFIETELARIVSDLHYLANFNGLYPLLTSDDKLIQTEYHNTLILQWMTFLEERKVYNKLRLMGPTGQYLISIDCDQGIPIVMHCADDEYYQSQLEFQEVKDHMGDSVYISEVRLGMKNGKLEDPHKPVMRISVPIYNEVGDVIGTVFVDYLAQHLINVLEDIAMSSMGTFSLLNKEGYWLSSVDDSQEWAFMYEDKAKLSFAWHHPLVWSTMTKQEEGQLYAYEGLYVYSTIDLNDLVRKNIAGSEAQHADYNDLADQTQLKVVSFRSAEQSLYYSNWPVISIITAQLFHHWLSYLGLCLSLTALFSLILYQSTLNRSQLRFFGMYDTLTGAYNRHYGLSRLQSDYIRHVNTGERFFVTFIDVNGLKEVNDALGHEQGDELLKTVVMVIQRHLVKGNYIIRMGGDEFLIHLHDISDEGVQNIFKKIVSDLNAINEQESRSYLISISIGNAQLTYDTLANLDELIGQADARMYKDKIITKKALGSVLKGL